MNILNRIKHHPKLVKLAGGVIILIVSLLVFWYTRPSPSQKLLAKISRHIVLPDEEAPAIATVSDKNQLEQQQFFTEAENGDILFVFHQSRKAILYRPSLDKIVNVTSVNINSAVNTVPVATPSQPESSTQTPTNTPEDDIKTSAFTVAVYNGTTIGGLASRMENRLKQELSAIKITTKENTKAPTYKEHLVIDNTGNKQREAEYIANLIQGTVVSLPDGEKKPTADILVIAGKEI